MRYRKILKTIALVLVSPLVFGGAAVDAPVEVDADVGIAFGNMTSARFSDNDVERIGCGVRYNSDGVGGVFAFGFCQAVDAAEVSLFCSTTNLELIEAIRSIADHSFITFGVDEDGECTRIGNSTQSIYLPDKKAK